MATYRVLGMTCQGCASAVAKAIQGVAPEAEVDVDLAGNAVSISGTHDETAVGGAVDDAGFEFAGRAS